MCSYNAINGVPTCANSFLQSVLRSEWKFDGYITGDTGAVQDIYSTSGHKYVSTAPEASCKAMKDGGTDIDSGSVYHSNLLPGVEKGFCSMSEVKRALHRTLSLRFKLGLFDPIDDQPYWHGSRNAVNTTASQETNKRMTEEVLVLLKNDAKTLPLGGSKSGEQVEERVKERVEEMAKD
jgi:beta-glucosidase-like glycosyl hydrolase